MPDWNHGLEVNDVVESKTGELIIGRITQLNSSRAWLDGFLQSFDVTGLKKVDEETESGFRRADAEVEQEITGIMDGNSTVIMSPQYCQLKRLNLLLQVFHRPDIRAAVNNQHDNMEIWDLLTECWSGVLDDLKGKGVG
jgi:hypothetical protein